MERAEDRFNLILNECVKNTVSHARLLSTFSLIENTGACKIHRFERFGFRDEFILQHAYEEAGHAFLFKKLANQICLKAGIPKEIMPFDQTFSRNLIRLLDIEANRLIAKTNFAKGNDRFYLSYLIVTLSIEKRALAIYSTYQRWLQSTGKDFSIETLINEEIEHRRYLLHLFKKRTSDAESLLLAMEVSEGKIFERWLDRISSNIGTQLKAVAGTCRQ